MSQNAGLSHYVALLLGLGVRILTIAMELPDTPPNMGFIIGNQIFSM